MASRDCVKADRFAAFGCAAVREYHALLEAPGIDAVYLPLPAIPHAEWIEKALLACKHALTENR